MIKLYTIGFTKKTAENFFGLLSKNNVTTLTDTRISNNSQLAGFAKGTDLAFFSKQILKANYLHKLDFAPTKELLDKYRKEEMDWKEYEIEYLNLLDIRKISNKISTEELHQNCFLCSEHTPEKCHRRLLAEYLQHRFTDIEIVHLIK